MEMDRQRPELDAQAERSEESPRPAGAEQLIIRRILVAMDASSDSRAALHAAAALAEVMHAELLGLFVEDINVLRLAELPFGREIRFPAAVSLRLEPLEIERQLRMRALELRRELEEITRAHQLQSSFRVVRGRVEMELLAAAHDVDLLALGRIGHSVAKRGRLGSTALAAALQAGQPVLLVRPDGDLSRPLVVVDDGSDAGARSVAIAASLLRRFSSMRTGELKVLIWAADDELAYARRQLLVAALGEIEVNADYQHFHESAPERLMELVNRQEGGLLVLPVCAVGLPSETVRRLLEDARQHVLVVH